MDSTAADSRVSEWFRRCRYRLSARQNNTLQFAVLSALLVVAAAGLVGQWRSEPLFNTTAANATLLNTVATADLPAPVTVELSVGAYRLMGAASSQSELPQKPRDLPKTQLPLTLKGIFHSSNQKAVGAVIGGVEGANFFGLGDRVDEGVVLKAVLADGVVLEREGYPEVLNFPPQWGSLLQPLEGSAALFEDTPAEPLRRPPPAVAEQPLQQRLNSIRKGAAGAPPFVEADGL